MIQTCQGTQILKIKRNLEITHMALKVVPCKLERRIHCDDGGRRQFHNSIAMCNNHEQFTKGCHFGGCKRRVVIFGVTHSHKEMHQ